MAVIELNNDARPTGIDYRNKKTAFRTFVAIGVKDPDAAKAAVAQEHGGINAPYPGIGATNLIVDSVETSAYSDGVSTKVTYNYSSDRRFGSPAKINKDAIGYYGFRGYATSEVVTVPYAVREKISLATGAGFEVDQDVWTLKDDKKITEPRARFVINSMVYGWDVGKSFAVLSQMKKVHKIGQMKLLFESGNWDRRTDVSEGDQYDVTYEWLYDPGTQPVDESTYDTARLVFPRVDRQPFWEYVAYLDPFNKPTTPQGKPIITSIPIFKEDLLGWKNLPGMPNL